MSRKKNLDDVRKNLTAAQLDVRRKQEAKAFELGIPASPPYLWNNRALWALWKKNATKAMQARKLAYCDGDALLEFCQCEALGDHDGMRRVWDATWKDRPPFPDRDPRAPGVPTLTEFLNRVKQERATFAQRLIPDETTCRDADLKPYGWLESDAATVARKYAADVLSGAIVACEGIQRSAKRFLSDLEQGASRGLFFDPLAARHIAQWTEWFCGIKPLPWQVFILANLFGWKTPSGLRRFSEAWISCAKKNGKTALSSSIALWGLVCDQEKFPDVFSAATKKDQARLCWRDAKRAVAECSELKLVVRMWAGSLSVPETDGSFQPLSSDVKSMDGTRPYFIIADEVSFWDDREQWDKLVKGNVSRTQPLTVAITTVGKHRDCFAWTKFDLAEKILKGIYPNDRVFVAIYSLDSDDNWEHEDKWLKANPSLGAPGMLTVETLRATAEEVRQSPSGLNAFLQYHCNLWPDLSLKQGGSVPTEKWDRCRGPYSKELSALDVCRKFVAENTGRECYGGLDIGLTSDLTAFVCLFPNFVRDGQTIKHPACVCFFWMPEHGLLEKEKQWQVPLSIWAREGWIKLIPGDMVDAQEIKQDLISLHSKGWRCRQVAYDKYQCQGIMAELHTLGIFEAVEVPQRYKELTIPSRELRTAIMFGKFAHLDNPVLRWMASNCKLEPQPNRNDGMKPEKLFPNGKIDGMTALAMAWERVLAIPPAPAWDGVIKFI
jgi:phage terminase large subunit-like protein